MEKQSAVGLDLRKTETAIKLIKDNFESLLANALNLQRVSAPIVVTRESGFNDNLSGVERVVSFDILNNKGVTAEIVQSLAKWKRFALKMYEFNQGEGLYTDMNAIRRDDQIDELHSIYVDQWDWERVITEADRNLNFLKIIVKKIVCAIADTADIVNKAFPNVGAEIAREVYFVTSQELEDMYPDKCAKKREEIITREHKSVCIMQIGGALKSGERHDSRAPDYDDWNLNCDILFWLDSIETAVEISSMGIRVSPEVLERQLILANATNRRELQFHKALLNNELPLTIGGGIGQSRLCMLLLKKHHIGEVQASIWPREIINEYAKRGIKLL
ncbi:MAG: aspartate--ammonia ligase [Clostridia bacterium]